MKKFLLITLSGLAALVLLGMVIVAVTGTHRDVEKLTLITDLWWLRLGGYTVLVAGWWLFSPQLVSRKAPSDGEGDQSLKEATRELRGAWWKLALFLAFFEIVIVRQFGVAS